MSTKHKNFDDFTDEEKDKIKSGECLSFSSLCSECFRECSIGDFDKSWLHLTICSRYKPNPDGKS